MTDVVPSLTILQPDERIFRYSVPVDDQWHEIALQGNPLAVDCRDSRVVEFWAREGGFEKKRWFRVVGTGQPLPYGPYGAPCDQIYWGTALSPAMEPFAKRGSLVWHLVGFGLGAWLDHRSGR
ncbi:MAG TPA: hypothetical protein VF174_08945 [Micromonosporaceae bacterium]